MLSPADVEGPGEDLGTEGPRAGFALTERELDERTTLIEVEGELDLSTAPKLKWPLVHALRARRDRFVVDLSAVTFMDSTALGVLVGVRRSLPRGARLAVVCEHPDVLRIFEVSGLDAGFDIFATRDEALAHVRGEEAPASR